MTAEVNEADTEITNVSKLIAATKKYTRIDELTPEILNTFVDKIVIHEREKKDGKRTQKIDIYYSYVGIVDIPTDEEMWEMEKCSILHVKPPKYRRGRRKSMLLPIHIYFYPYLV